ncbi:MAG: FAD-dependent oxidoreductase, partial [Planctomycetota bacterium]
MAGTDNSPNRSLFSGHVIVVGGGVVGASIAWELRRRQNERGATTSARVTVIDQHDEPIHGRSGAADSGTSTNTTIAAAGILPAPDPGFGDAVEQLRCISHPLHAKWSRRLRDETGIDNGLVRCGGIYLATRPGEVAAMAASVADWRMSGIDVQDLSVEDVARDQPAIADVVRRNRRSMFRAWYVPDEHRIHAVNHLAALRSACLHCGVRWRASTIVKEIDSVESSAENTGQRALRLIDAQGNSTQDGNPSNEDGEMISADAVVLATGAWTSLLGPSFPVPRNIYPVRGQMLCYRDAGSMDRPFGISRIINEGHRYLVPRGDGTLLVGSNEEEAGFDCRTTQTQLDRMRQWAGQWVSRLASESPIDSWAGLRPASMDTFPYIGRVPETDNVFVAAGHFRSGIHLSCGTALLIADMLEDKPPLMDLSPF